MMQTELADDLPCSSGQQEWACPAISLNLSGFFTPLPEFGQNEIPTVWFSMSFSPTSASKFWWKKKTTMAKGLLFHSSEEIVKYNFSVSFTFEPNEIITGAV